MRSLRGALISWFLLFSLGPLFFISYFMYKAFEFSYENETQLRLTAVTQEVEARVDLYQNLLSDFLTEGTPNRVVFGASENSRVKTKSKSKTNLKDYFEMTEQMIKLKPLDGVAIYDQKGRLLASAQKNEKQSISYFPNKNAKQNYYLPAETLNRIPSGGGLYYAIKVFKKRKLGLIQFSYIESPSKKQKFVIEVTKYLTVQSLKELQKKRKADIVIVNTDGQKIISTWADAPSDVKIYQGWLQKEDETIRYQRGDIASYLVQTKKIYWGKGAFYFLAISSREAWTQALTEIRFFISVALVGIAIVLVVAIFSVTSKIIQPLQNLLSVTRKILYDKEDIHLDLSSFTEINLLSESLMVMAKDIRDAQSKLVKNFDELKSAQAQLVQSEKMNSLGLLVAGIAHEINNPMGYMISNLLPLKEQIEELAKELPKDNQAIKECFEIIDSLNQGASHIKKIISGLALFAKSPSSHLGQVDLKSVIDSTLILLGHEIKDKQIQVEWFADKSVFINADATALSQIFLNIIINAIHVLESAGKITININEVTISEAETENERGDHVRGQAQEQSPNIQKEYAEVSISDNGPGMGPAVAGRIFEPFFTTKPVGKGTGLGLSIAYQIVQSFGGKLYFKTELGQGTTFYVRLPLSYQNSQV